MLHRPTSRALAILLVCAPLSARALSARALAAQSPRDTLRSAPIANVRYDVTFDRATAAQRRLHVATTFDVAGDGDVLLSLPVWTPGAYELGQFAHWVVGFAAEGAGKPLAWDKADYDTWRVRPAGARTVSVSFDFVADTLDNAIAWSRPDFALFNGTNVFLYPEGRPFDWAARVTVHTESGWKVATGMTPVRGAANTYTAPNYHDLVDMPFFVGAFDVDSAPIAGKTVRFASYPAGSVSGQARATVWDQLRRVIPPEVAVFGEVPWADYTVMQIADSSYQGASGLEHQSSHVDIVTPLAIGNDFMPSLYAHEIFHSWNVKRLRPADMWPYVYDRPEPTPWLWVSEGITDYYADLAEVRGGVVQEPGFYALTAAKINEVESAPAVSLEDASLSTWVHPLDGTGYLYYPKGSLAGLLLDVMIRDASDNKQSLDGVMRELYQRSYKQGRGFTAADWWGAVSRAAGGRSFTEFAARYIDGRDPFPWDTVLPLAGLRLVRDRVPRLGVASAPDQEGVRVSEVTEGSAAAGAGVRVGDYLVSVGEIPVTDPQFGARFRTRYGTAAEGSALPIVVRRNGQTTTLAAQLRFGPGEARLETLPGASAKATRIRTGILRGTTGR